MADGASASLDKLHARLLRGYDALVQEFGGDIAAIRRRTRLDATETADTYRDLTRLLEAASSEVERPDFGLELAKRQDGGAFGPLSLVMRNSRTLADALGYVAGHSQAHSLAARIWIRRNPETNMIFVGHEILVPDIASYAQAMEQILLIGHLGAIRMTAGSARVRRVHFRHRPLSPAKTYRRHFGCEVRFGEFEDGVFFEEDDFARPLVDTNAEAYLAATAYIDASFPPQSRPLHADARGHIMQLLAEGRCTNTTIAERLSLHPRTLHRRLEAEGTSFQRVKDEVRRDVMVYYLTSTELDLGTISERLGFAEQAVMSRFCRSVLKTSPTALRARSRAERSSRR